MTLQKSILYFLLLLILPACKSTSQVSTATDFNRDWKFKLDEKKQWSSAEENDATWRTVHLPHDWSIELAPDSIKGEGATAYLLGGMGWYRKHFVTTTQTDEITYLIFDGVYNNSEIFLNGKKIGERPYGYAPFYFDLTPFLKSEGEENILAVKVDRTRYADSRWYTGSGIYRNVELKTVPKIHVPIWGTFLTTPEVTAEKAKVNFKVKVVNGFSKNEKDLVLKYEIFDPSGKKVAEQESKPLVLSPAKEIELEANFEIKQAQLWDVESPQLYRAVATIFQQGKNLGAYPTTFGIRSFRFDTDKGFFLNGKNMKIKGVCLHHDGGLVGAAVPKAVWRRRLTTLKEGGCNAIRISHNPGSQEFLDLCDEMGFLVQDEFFDEWDFPKDKRRNMNEQSVDYITRGYTEHFQEWAERDLKNTVLAHRNHPSIFQWSIGNEIEWTYPRNKMATGFFDNMDWSGNYFWSQPPFSPEKIRQEYSQGKQLEYDIGTTAKKLAKWTKELDTTRPVIANCILPSASYESGYADALDIIGYSYRRVMYDYGKKHYPDLPIMGTENLGQYHEWKAIMERPFISGTFLWTGVDYLGESNNSFPKKATTSGLLDLAGFQKPSYHMMKSLWTKKAHLYISTQSLGKSIYKIEAEEVREKQEGAWEKALWSWHQVNEHWNYDNEEMVIVEIISNCTEVELFLNEKSLGKQKLADFADHIYKWAVPFAEGKLRARGFKNGELVEEQIVTATEPLGFQVKIDKPTLAADGYDVAHVVVQLVDENQNPVRHLQKEITFTVTGAVKNLGVDNGSPSNVQPYQTNKIMTSNGRALLILQSTLKKGVAEIRVSGEGMKTAAAKIIMD